MTLVQKVKRGVQALAFTGAYFVLFGKVHVFSQGISGARDQITAAPGAPSLGNDPFAIVVNIALWAVYIMAAVSILFLVYGGIRWGTDTGDGKGAEAGQRIVINSIIGLVIAALAVIIIQIVLGLLGQLGEQVAG